ncbi:alpha/beta hydrolase [Agrobacterium vitis]|uniref:alpha/beta hydrolase n=1 Tax=Agrobacterium vitis TaxID=373 RepID=UPI003D28B4BD
MSKISGFHCEIDGPDETGSPIVMLHGSGQDETCWGDIPARIGPGSPIVRVRGNIIWEGKYAFFRRKPDRTLDLADLARSASEISLLLESLTQRFTERKPILIGYSNGAILSAAVLRDFPDLIDGAILLRGLSSAPASPFPRSVTCPVLVISGETDSRRTPQDGAILASQLVAAGAPTSYHLLPCGHGWDPQERDLVLMQDWLCQVTRRTVSGS